MVSDLDRARAASLKTEVNSGPIIPQAPEPEPDIKVEDAQPPASTQAPPEPSKTPEVSTPALDPYEPLKSRLGDRGVDDWLLEVDATASERDDYRRKLEVLELTAREQADKLAEYDMRHSPEFEREALAPIKRAEEELLYLFSNSNEAIKEGLAIFNNKEMDAKTKADHLKAFATEYGLPPLDVRRAFLTLQDAYSNAQKYQQNWESIKTEKQKAALAKQEESRKLNEETFRRTYKTAAFKAEAKLKQLGIPINGYEDARESYLNTVESMLQQKPADIEQEALYSVLGRMVFNGRAELTEQLQRLAKLEEGSRIDPKSAPKPGSANVATTYENPITKRSQLV